MSKLELDSMATLVESLSKSFIQVPPSAIPAMLDCILLSTGLSPQLLFASLSDDFPRLHKDIVKEDEKLDSNKCIHLMSLVGAFCHLLKKTGTNYDAVQSFTWRCFLPLAKVLQAFQYDLLNQITELFIDVVIETHTWPVLEETLVPIVLRSVGLSMETLHNEDSYFYEWSSGLWPHVSYDLLTHSPLDKELSLSFSSCFTLRTSCQVLSAIVEATLQCRQTAMLSKSVEENGCFADKFVTKLMWELCNMTEQMLLYSPEHRSCAVGFLLPIMFKAFASNPSFRVAISGQEHALSREDFFIKLWKCCRTLFSMGPLERREAYNVLSLCFSFLHYIEEREDVDTICRMEQFDIRTEKEFWDDIKKGLVDKESLVRKQSLHILKVALNIHGGTNSTSSVSKQNPGKRSIPHGVTKRELWAYKEARSLGVGNILALEDLVFNSKQYWEAFLLLYEMLEEYGTHLVEAAWNHQVSLLLRFSLSDLKLESNISEIHGNHIEKCDEIFTWLSILWERGLHHDNPQVRCLIMQSFLDINWEHYGNYVKSVPETFILGPLMQGLNDPIQHKEFGVRGVYMSRTIEFAARFLQQYASCLAPRKCIAFLCNLASTAKHQSFGRAGLMGLAECIASAATGIGTLIYGRKESIRGTSHVEFSSGMAYENDETELLDVFRYVIESSKQHFNPNYRLQVCQKILEAAVSVVCTFGVPLEILLLLISALPREFTDCGGSLRVTVQRWLLGCDHKDFCANCCSGDEMKLWKSLYDFPQRFVCHQLSTEASFNYDDEDVSAWEVEANRWARVLFLATKEEHLLGPILTFIQSNGVNILKQNHDTKYIPVKFLILALSLVLELQRTKERATEYGSKARTDIWIGLVDYFSLIEGISEELVDKFLLILEDMFQFANQSCSIFWSGIVVEDTTLSGSVKGKLGGPSQRRLSTSTNIIVLQAIMSVKALSLILAWCTQIKSDASLGYAVIFMWQFFWRTTRFPPSCSEIEAEICLAAYEALVFVLRVLASTYSHQSLYLIKENEKLLLETEGRPQLDSMLVSFTQNINNLLGVGFLARTRRAVLLDWKWMCIESLLSIPSHALKNGLHVEGNHSFFSDGTLRSIFNDLIESLENAGEGSVLTMLRSVRMVLELVALRKSSAVVSKDVIDAQMMWHLVHSSWILHVSCNKRRVASIAALLSSVLHPSVFNDESMHETDNAPGPLKWFIVNLLEEGIKSPRTIRLAALHLTGLWLSNPRIIRFYLKELKLLTLYGSVAFDEDFEAELAENNDARLEVSLLARSPDPELTEAFINTELYARVSVAVLFHKLADLASMKSSNINEDCTAALACGKLFLLELLDSAVNDKYLAKELYKKYSAIHRRKVRLWQSICVLSPFVEQDIVGKVVEDLCLSLNRNNLPAVRQYLETFAINIYLKFPSLVRDQLVPILRNCETRPQALSSYVFIAANVILHSSGDSPSGHLDELLPPLVPLLTSHHHSLRGFTQLLLHQILHKLFPLLNSGSSEILTLEKRCLVDLKTYLAKNSDCARLRASMEGYLDAYNPNSSVTPAGIFINRVEEVEFECVPTSLMDQVVTFLNDVREDLRYSMAKDVVTIRNESLRLEGDTNGMEELSVSDEGTWVKDMPSDFQKKVTLAKHNMGQVDIGSFYGNEKTYRKIAEMEEDDLLLDKLQSRSLSLEQLKASRQNFILVASLLDRIPNLAGLARTCEVFRASGLTVADINILNDKQFQLISVTAEKWVPIVEVPVNSVKAYLQKKKREGFSILGLEQTANSVPLDQFMFPKKTVLVLGREKEGIPVDIIHTLDACIEIPQLGVVRSLNVHVSGAIAMWEYTRQRRSQ